jgi:hypothetical protein
MGLFDAGPVVFGESGARAWLSRLTGAQHPHLGRGCVVEAVRGGPGHVVPGQRGGAPVVGPRAAGEGTRLSLHQGVEYVRRATGRRRRPAAGWPSLTPTEIEVVRLVAEGLTNPQIGVNRGRPRQ